MPFEKVGKNNYVSPSGRHFNQKQVGLYYSLGGRFPGQASDTTRKQSPARPRKTSKRGK